MRFSFQELYLLGSRNSVLFILIYFLTCYICAFLKILIVCCVLIIFSGVFIMFLISVWIVFTVFFFSFCFSACVKSCSCILDFAILHCCVSGFWCLPKGVLMLMCLFKTVIYSWKLARCVRDCCAGFLTLYLELTLL